MKKIVSIILSFVMITSISTAVFSKELSSEDVSAVSRKEEIIENYKNKLSELKLQSTEISMKERASNLASAKLDIQTETVNALQNAGYEAYNVNPQTFESVEDALNTDLASAGLSENGSYIILIEGENNNNNTGISPMANTSTSFEHTYNGTTYTLRWMTMFVTDDPIYEKYSQVNLLKSNVRSVIERFLDASVDIIVGKVSKRAGIIKTILGIDISDFMVSYDAYMDYNATSTWTRRYTQVWSTYDQRWTNGCCVEEVEAASYINGWYYDVSLNTKNPLVKNFNKQVYYSDYYNDFTWRKNSAVIGYLSSTIRWDVTDDVKYKYNGKVIITHPHNF